MISLASGSGGRDSRGVSLKSLKEVCIFLLLYLMILPQFFFHLAIGHESSLGVYWNRISSVFILISAFFVLLSLSIRWYLVFHCICLPRLSSGGSSGLHFGFSLSL